MLSQSTWLTAVQLQSAGADTSTEPDPPFEGRLALVGEVEKSQKLEGTRATKTVESCE
jgi:hypothetical protein